MSKTDVKKAIEDIESELKYVFNEVGEISNNSEIDTDTIERYVADVQSAIDKAKDKFEEYESEVTDIEDDFEGLVERLREVSK